MVGVGLVASCFKSAVAVFTDAAVPSGSALYKALETQEAQELLATPSQLERIFLTCGPASVPRDPFSRGSMEMSVTITACVGTMCCVGVGRWQTFSMTSGLGPFPNESDPAAAPFDRRDTLGPARAR
jgi:hypothetical protein